MTDAFDADVVVVGLGPVGATAANLAHDLGLRVVAVDRATRIEPRPRAIGFDQEAMRVFAGLGLADTIAPHVMPYRPSEYHNADGRVIRRIGTAPPPHPLGWAPNYVFLQPRLESALRQRLEECAGVETLLGTEATDVRLEDGGVRVATTDLSGRHRTLRARYVLACDGGASPLRTGLGLGMRDLEFDEPWLVVDVLLRSGAGQDLPRTNVQYCETARPSTFVVGPGNLRRWEFMINPGEDPEEVSREEFVRGLLSRWLDPGDYELWRASSYRFHALVLRQWRAGRVFFLGDAAHMTPPFLAQGMCQGIRDASNLVWKLALQLRGVAEEPLLDTYQREREPHVRQVTLAAKELGRIICERDDDVAAQRDAELLGELAARPEGIVRQSLIPGLTAGFLAPVGSPARGDLLPQPTVTDVRGQEGLLDTFTGGTFRLVVRHDVDASTAERALCAHRAAGGFPLRLVRMTTGGTPTRPDEYLETGPLLDDWMRQRSCAALLARPDHYVFGGARSAEDIESLLHSADRQLRPWAHHLGEPPARQRGVA
ncbi:bifunctional 3-(3-hydroxy-phenyl)propionate/3-hydroxycinnamic acid hydroxylase [Streptomyces sp. ME02-8801-2C]|uniref:bifunctional 3-(3-hydroxy-phenyl)propionate/3-hydroxycinnamic acid hydroxylase n=1 Tax=Streptomyces sp. ME02-8801-2C TaxID=3028680 RepID=UPI0029B460AB|nr:bifunctional 3-(3-hydroxy-phenyl)propionate/3-hydroxycinnamic acid hydroxylase [Streptomyces sp. ME02-8801-2C]MDX3451538.1 bifunctional 3-(3-hydroxy-phenyl)propionate/3-hydroxycinnamic acid hydroxylase [Streptomyces sp. ME02-8801-2C]